LAQAILVQALQLIPSCRFSPFCVGGFETPMRAAETGFLESGTSDDEQLTRESSVIGSTRRRYHRQIWALAVSAVFIAAAVLLQILGRGLLVRKEMRGAGTVYLATTETCHTAVEGEPCFADVDWAMKVGITGHPDWYEGECPGLKPTSDFEEFQACVYKINMTTCPLPCNPAGFTALQDLVDQTHKAHTKTDIHEEPCHIAKKGEDCYSSVINAMLQGIDEHPGQFPGLTKESSFEEFQAVLHNNPGTSSCPRPCNCHTADETDECFKHVVWARDIGIRGHPDWYHGIRSESTFEDIQAYLHKHEKGHCPLPCTVLDLSKVEAPEVVTDDQDSEVEEQVEEELAKQLAKGANTSGRHYEHEHEDGGDSDNETCDTAVKGQTCYDDVMYAMQKGIHEHADWYPGLTPASTFEDFQAAIHKRPEKRCPAPCHCHTARQGETCSARVKWVLREGLEAHPSWYKGFTVRSRFEDVQSRLHEDAKTKCQAPCAPRVWGSPSIFCFSVFRSQGYELDLVKAQVDKGVGIFSCDEFRVLSDETLPVSKGIETLKIPPCESVGVSKDGTAANTLIFMQAWFVIWHDATWRAHDWVIKADPDAVVLVDRLRTHLKPHTGKNVFMKNCMKYTGPGWPMMFGSLEAFTHEAMETYFKGEKRCRNELQWQAWGEDLYMGNCLTMLGASSEFDGGLIGDNVCKGANCGDGTTAVYHPFKSAESWFQCHDQATR